MLKQRVLTAIIALGVLTLVLFVIPQAAAQAVIVALILAGAWEWGGFFTPGGRTFRVGSVVTIGALIGILFSLLPDDRLLGAILMLAMGWWLVVLGWMFFFPTAISMPVIALCGVLTLLPAWAALDFLYLQDPRLLLFSLLIVWVADIGAYFVGRGFGRVKLAPKISPGKSWEGVLGGLSAVVILAGVGNHLLGTEIAVLLPLCVAVAMISVVGDLSVSMFKRNAGVKDSGALFPGHGGVLDRIDSVTAAVPLFALASAWIGLT